MSVSVTLKLATSLDGRIALSDGTSQWITSSESRARGHEMRATHDAIMVGIGTALADDPLLTARTTPSPSRQPIRLIADTHGRLSLESRLANSAGLGRVALATTAPANKELEALGVELWRCGEDAVEPRAILQRLELEGASSLLLEGGGRLAASFLKGGHVTKISWFRAPIVIGGDGLAGVGELGLTRLDAASRWTLAATEQIGDDVLDTYLRAG